MSKPPAYFRKEITGLRPIGHIAEEVMAKIKINSTVRVEVHRARNIRRHNLYWAVLAKVVDNLEGVTAKKLHDAIKIKLGYVTLIRTRSKVYEIPDSTSFDEMDEATFQTYMDGAFKFLCEEVIPGMEPSDLLNEALMMIEGKAA